MSPFAKPEAEADRARQVASLLKAVYDAQQLEISLSNTGDSTPEVKQLFCRLEMVRLEIEHLHSIAGPVSLDEIDPKWTGLVPWRMIPEC